MVAIKVLGGVRVEFLADIKIVGQYVNTCMMASGGDKASNLCLRCKKDVLDGEKGIACGGCEFWFHAKCEKVSAELYRAIVSFEEKKEGSKLVWYCACCAKTVERVEKTIGILKAEVEKLKARVISLESNESLRVSEGPSERAAVDGASGLVRNEVGIVRSEVVSWPVRQQVNEAMEIERRKDKLVISGIKESDDAEEKVGEILLEMGYRKAFQVVERVGRLGGPGRSKDRLIRVKLDTISDKWRLIAGAKKLAGSSNFKDVYIMPDLTRKQADEDRQLRLKLKELREADEIEGGVKIHRGKIICRGGDHRVIFDPTV